MINQNAGLHREKQCDSMPKPKCRRFLGTPKCLELQGIITQLLDFNHYRRNTSG
jgi:hypothetical protein